MSTPFSIATSPSFVRKPIEPSAVIDVKDMDSSAGATPRLNNGFFSCGRCPWSRNSPPRNSHLPVPASVCSSSLAPLARGLRPPSFHRLALGASPLASGISRHLEASLRDPARLQASGYCSVFSLQASLSSSPPFAVTPPSLSRVSSDLLTLAAPLSTGDPHRRAQKSAARSADICIFQLPDPNFPHLRPQISSIFSVFHPDPNFEKTFRKVLPNPSSTPQLSQAHSPIPSLIARPPLFPLAILHSSHLTMTR